jgi:hypothetical protein
MQLSFKDYFNRYFFISAAAFVFSLIVLYKPGIVSYTFDEREDVRIIECIQDQGPFNCLYDISQTRFPYYIHLLFVSLWKTRTTHYLVTWIFGLFSLFITWNFCRKEFNLPVANIAALVFISSIPLLTSGRMLLTHSNLIFTCFNLVAVLQFYYFAKNRSFNNLIFSALFFGLATGSSILAVFTAFLLSGLYLLLKSPFQWKHLLFIPLSIAVFFLSTVIYVKADNFSDFIDGIRYGHEFPLWNYLSTGNSKSPYWFSFLLFAVKTGIIPVLLLILSFVFLLKDYKKGPAQLFLLVSLLYTVFYLIMKSIYFRYDAPHHHVHLYPVLTMAIAYAVYETYSRIKKTRYAFIAFLAAAMAWQVYEIKRFFPNLIFYGSQYGDNFIGEFYGPAVMHGHDTDEFFNELKKITTENPEAVIIYQENNAFDPEGPNFVSFSGHEELPEFDYLIKDYCFSHHFNPPEKRAFNELADNNCEEIYVYYFPDKVWMYKIYKCK